MLNFARKHYENFPVVSFLIPKEYRKDIAAIYWFARTADDIADEGNVTPEDRIAALDEFRERFNSTLAGEYHSNYDEFLHKTIIYRNLSANYFLDLISAFRQDILKKRYKDYPELLDYCRRSANPVGRLLLELFNVTNPLAFNYSDDICTALQLTNFFQDTAVDFRKGRIYFPEDEMARFGVSEKSFELTEINDNLKKMVKFNIERTENMFNNGTNLLQFLKGRFRLEINWTIRGGKAILNKIRKNDYNVFIRPKLGRLDFTGILIKSLFI